MGFLDPVPGDMPPAPPQEEKTYGGFLSDNPPPPPKQEEKVPEWSQIPLQAAVNAPESAVQYAKDFMHPFFHPIDTAESLGGLALGLAQKAGIKIDGEYEKYPDAVGQLIMDRYGSVDNFKKTMAKDPVGTLGDISTVLSPGSLVARAPGIVGKIGKTLSTVSKVTDPLNVPRAGLWGAKKVGAVGAGVTTGAGMRNFEEAGRAGYPGEHGAQFREAQAGVTSPRDLVDTARDAVAEIVKERGNLYNAQKGGINNNQILSFNRLNRAMVDAHKINKFGTEELGESTKALRDALDNRIMHWATLDKNTYHTPLGFDALKKALNDIGDQHATTPAQKAIVAKYADAVKGTLTAADPKYAKLMKTYSEFSDSINELQKAFSLPTDVRKQSVDTAFRKLQSALRRNVNTNFGWRETLLDMLEEKSPGIKAAIAGHSLASPEPHGLVRLVPGLSTANAHSLGDVLKHLVVTSPLLMGRIAHNLGRAAGATSVIAPRGTSEALRQLGRLDQAERDKEPYKRKLVVIPTSGGEVIREARGGAVERARRLARKH